MAPGVRSAPSSKGKLFGWTELGRLRGTKWARAVGCKGRAATISACLTRSLGTNVLRARWSIELKGVKMMTIGVHTPSPTPQERRKIRFGKGRQIVIAVGAAVAAIVGILALATD